MSKKSQMIEYMVQDLVEMLTESKEIGYDVAMRSELNRFFILSVSHQL